METIANTVENVADDRIEKDASTDRSHATPKHGLAKSEIRLASTTEETEDGASPIQNAIIKVTQQVQRAAEPQPDDPKKEQTTDQTTESFIDSAVPLRVEMPRGIPGASSPPILLPPMGEEHRDEREAAYDRQFPAPADPRTIPEPTGRPMTLAELEELALVNSPVIIQTSAGITMSQGGVIQAGVYPNPTFGYESDTVGSSFTRDYQGIVTSQTIKTAGKVPLQRAIANMDYLNSQLLLRRTQLDIRRQVRAGYYNVLVAQEANRINESLLRFTIEVYRIMVKRLKQGEQAAYEPAQLRTFVAQARMALVQSQNRYTSAWKQLAAVIGIPDLPPAPLATRVDMPVPNLDFDALLNRAVNVHPDIEASRNFEAQSRLNLRLQEKIPIPDVTISGVFQNDFTTPGYGRTSYNMNVGFPLPIFDQNKGNRLSAQGKVTLASQQLALTRNTLQTQLADSFERYQTGRVQAEYYRTQVLPDLVRAYHGVYERHIQQPAIVAFGDLIVAQQNLGSGISVYITVLLQQWVAATDIANVIQLEDFQDLFGLPTAKSGPSMPDDPQTPTTEGTKP